MVKMGMTKFDYVINNICISAERKKNLKTTNLIQKFKHTLASEE
jgi:hypothetical protein